MFDFIHGTSGMIKVFKMIVNIGKGIVMAEAVAVFVFSLYWAFDEMKGKTVLIAMSIMFTGIIISVIGLVILIYIIISYEYKEETKRTER